MFAKDTVESFYDSSRGRQQFSHVKPEDTEFTGGGLRDLLSSCIALSAASAARPSQVLCHLV